MDTLSIEGYTFLRELGSGGYGRVLLAEKRGSGTLVAIKCFDPVNDLAIQAACSEAHSTPNHLQEAFLEYAQAIRDLPRREGLVAVLDSGRAEDGLPYYISPYIPGCLADLLGKDVFDPVTVGQLPEAHRPRRLKPERVMQIFEQALMALQQMHAAGRVHGDIKPVNLRMTTAGDLCLVDFSILRTAEGLAARGGFAPNRDCFDYSCPQLRHNPLAAEPSADLYSLACVCYRALTGTLPSSDFAKPAARIPGLDDASNDLLLWMLDPDSNARPLDAATALDAYRSIQRSHPAHGDAAATPPSTEQPPPADFTSRVIATQETEVGKDTCILAQPSDSDTPTELMQTVADRHGEPVPPAETSDDAAGAAAADTGQNATRIVDSGGAATQLMAADSGDAPSWRTPEQRRTPPAASDTGKGRWIGILAGVLVLLAVGGFVGWQYLAKVDTPVVPVTQPVPVAEIAADRARMETEWDLALERNSLEGFQDFVANWPNSPLAERARSQIEQLRAVEQREAELALQREQTRDTVLAELTDLGYLDPQQASEPGAVDAAISEFELAAGLPRRGQADETTLIALRAERTRREDEAWIGALETDSEAGYLGYQDRYPEGRYAEQVAQKLAELRQRERERMLAEQLAAEEAAERRAAEQAAQRRGAEQALAAQRSERIDQIQAQLQRLGIDLDRSGELDPATREALDELQQPADEGLSLSQLDAILASLSALPEPIAAVDDEPFVPVILRRVEPRYPSRAARERTEGWLEAELSVDAQGQVIGVITLDTSHRRLFDREVEEAVRQWRFEPRIVNGEAIPFTTRQRFDFRLDGG